MESDFCGWQRCRVVPGANCDHMKTESYFTTTIASKRC